MLPHPLPPEEKRRLLPAAAAKATALGAIPRPLSALFPELYHLPAFRDSYLEDVVERFRMFDLARGDQTDEHVRQARRLLEDSPIHGGCAGDILEDATNRARAARFLARHYFFHGMFPWFWRLRGEMPPEARGDLARQALEMGFYQGLPLDELRSHLDVALTLPGADRQRLWHLFAVMQMHRQDLAQSLASIAQAAVLLEGVPTAGGERGVREAELLNATALFYYRAGMFPKAATELARSERILQGVEDTHPRRRELIELIAANSGRLQRAAQRGGA